MKPRILVPIDDSSATQQTVKTIINQKNSLPRYLTLLHVIQSSVMVYRMVPDFQFFAAREMAKTIGKDILDKTSRKLRIAGFTTETVLEYGEPRKTIIDTANHADFVLLIIGRHQKRFHLPDALFGSMTNHVMQNVKCPVLVC